MRVNYKWTEQLLQQASRARKWHTLLTGVFPTVAVSGHYSLREGAEEARSIICFAAAHSLLTVCIEHIRMHLDS